MTAHAEDDVTLTDAVLDALARREPAAAPVADPAVRLLGALAADVDDASDYRLSVSMTPST